LSTAGPSIPPPSTMPIAAPDRPWRHPPRGARLRADARGGDGGVRQELAAGEMKAPANGSGWPVLLPALLTACGAVRSNQIANMNAQQVQTLSDNGLCRPWTSSNAAVMTERGRRGLADCSEAALQCKSMGYAPGTELYLRCRTMISQRAAQSDAYSAALLATSARMMTPPPSPMIHCTSMGMGNMVTTDCQQ
jgi:hypothetical protein